MYKLYNCENTTNWIQYKINDKIADFDACNIDHVNIKQFFETLKKSIDELKKIILLKLDNLF